MPGFRVRGSTRYPVYCAVSDSMSSVSSPPTSCCFGGGIGMMQQQPVQVPSYTTFTPGLATTAPNNVFNGNAVQQMPVAPHQSPGIQQIMNRMHYHWELGHLIGRTTDHLIFPVGC